MNEIFLIAMLVVLISVIIADLFAGTYYSLRFLERAGQLFAFAIGVGALTIYCIWCWIRGKQHTNIFN